MNSTGIIIMYKKRIRCENLHYNKNIYHDNIILKSTGTCMYYTKEFTKHRMIKNVNNNYELEDVLLYLIFLSLVYKFLLYRLNVHQIFTTFACFNETEMTIIFCQNNHPLFTVICNYMYT